MWYHTIWTKRKAGETEMTLMEAHLFGIHSNGLH
jgi:hypothetical protein